MCVNIHNIDWATVLFILVIVLLAGGFTFIFILCQVAPTSYGWQSGHADNRTGTEDAYVPYSTTKPKVEAWVPHKRQ